MFTGIIETTGIIRGILGAGTNKTFWVASPISDQLKTDQSISHDGICLTVEEVKEGLHRVTAIEETINKTNLAHWKTGSIINLERCMQLNGRLDGHIVQGHVDTTAECTGIISKEGSWEYRFSYNKKFAALLIEKGSVCLNGISLTVFNVTADTFTVAVIPYTFENTSMQHLQKGNHVNIEFDVIGKYVNRIAALK